MPRHRLENETPQTVTEGRHLAERAELVDARSWLDQHDAAPPEVREAFGLRHQLVDGLAMVAGAIPFSHFNMVLTLGCPAPADDHAWTEVEQFYGQREHWIVTNDHSDPSLPAELARRGYQPIDTWDRIVLTDHHPARWAAGSSDAELVHTGNAQAWAGFVVACYGMPPLIGTWLRALVGRPGWVHAILCDGHRPGRPVVMARSAFIDGDWAWLGIDAPIPGVMAPCYGHDQIVTAALLVELVRRGVRHITTDIEHTDPQRRGPAYDGWFDLGFRPAYRRTVHHRSSTHSHATVDTHPRQPGSGR
jgi:hypothetical protein